MALPSGGDINSVGMNGLGGDTLGISTSSLISFYGVSPIAQGAAVTTVTTTGASSTTNAYGYTTAAQADAIVTAVNALISRLSLVGLTA